MNLEKIIGKYINYDGESIQSKNNSHGKLGAHGWKLSMGLRGRV